MKLPTKLVAVKKISSEVARSQFSTENIEQIAQLIIAVEGVINPIILRRTSLESYEVVQGHLEYYAALRAREINPRKGEMIQAIMLETENEKAILAQVDCLRSQSTLPLDPPVPSPNKLEVRLTNLEKIFQTQFEALRQDNQKLESQIRTLQKNMNHTITSPQIDQNHVIDKIVDRLTRIEELLNRRVSGTSRKKTLEELKQNPIDLNQASAVQLSTVPQVGPATANRIIEWREVHGSFSNIDDLSKIFSPQKIKSNGWHECFTVE